MNLYQDVFFRALDLARGRRTIRSLHFLRRSQRWPLERLRRWQLERLNALLGQARLASPLFAERLAQVRLPLRSLEQIEQIPPLTKEQIRTERERIRTNNLPRRRYVLSRTGGSTGEPTFYYWDRRGMDWNRASVYRSAEWAGTALGERALQMSGSHFDYDQARRLWNRVVYLLQRYRDCSVAYLTEERLEAHFRTLMRFRPASIWGYASGVDVFAGYIERHHPGVATPFLKAVITSSETLQPQQRRRIERVFGPGTVFDHYGSREMYLAAECRAHEGYHVHAEVLLLEVVDRDNRACAPGQRGRILVTDLSNHAFPFIRYEIGDVGVAGPTEPCSCGVTLPRLARVEGRIADLVVLRDRVLTPPNFATLFSDKPGIRAYQIRQPALDELEVRMEPGEGYDESVRRYIEGAILEMVQGQARVRVLTDAPIPVPESGKRRTVVSEVARGCL